MANMFRELNGIYEKVSYDDNRSIRFWFNQEAENYDIHWHTAAEIVMPLENDYTVIVGGQRHELKERDICFIPPGELHTLISRPTGKRIILMFDYSIISSIRDYSAISAVLSQSLVITPDNYGEIQDTLVGLIHKIRAEYENHTEPLRHAMIDSYLLQFFVQIGRAHIHTETMFPDVRSSKQMEYFDKMNSIVSYVNKNYTEDLSLDSVAAIAGFSKFHFSRLFKQFTDTSFYAYLNQRRVKAAESLLLNPHLSITDVALQSGFPSISTFNRVFRQIKECTPSEYKALYRHKGGIGL